MDKPELAEHLCYFCLDAGVDGEHVDCLFDFFLNNSSFASYHSSVKLANTSDEHAVRISFLMILWQRVLLLSSRDPNHAEEAYMYEFLY